MVEASLTAQICDLLGEDPFEAPPARKTVGEALSTCPRGGVMPAREGDRDVAVAVLHDGRAFVMEDRCPHDGGRISDGFVEGDTVVCARHGWEIDPCTGSCPRRARVTAIRSRPVPGRPVSGRPGTP